MHHFLIGLLYLFICDDLNTSWLQTKNSVDEYIVWSCKQLGDKTIFCEINGCNSETMHFWPYVGKGKMPLTIMILLIFFCK